MIWIFTHKFCVIRGFYVFICASCHRIKLRQCSQIVIFSFFFCGNISVYNWIRLDATQKFLYTHATNDGHFQTEVIALSKPYDVGLTDLSHIVRGMQRHTRPHTGTASGERLAAVSGQYVVKVVKP